MSGSAFLLLIVALVTGAMSTAYADVVGVESSASGGWTIARIHALNP